MRSCHSYCSCDLCSTSGFTNSENCRSYITVTNINSKLIWARVFVKPSDEYFKRLCNTKTIQMNSLETKFSDLTKALQQGLCIPSQWCHPLDYYKPLQHHSSTLQKHEILPLLLHF